jgi:hypothetical protein
MTKRMYYPRLATVIRHASSFSQVKDTQKPSPFAPCIDVA